MSVPFIDFNTTSTEYGNGDPYYLRNGAPQNPVVIGTSSDPTQDYQIIGSSNGFFIVPPAWDGNIFSTLMYIDGNQYRTSFYGTDVLQSGVHQIQATFDYPDPFTPLLGPKVVFIQDGGDNTRMGIVGMSANFNTTNGQFNFPSSMTLGVYDDTTNIRNPSLAVDVTGVLKVPVGIQKCAPLSISTIQGTYPYVSNSTNPALRTEVSTIVVPSGNSGSVTYAQPFQSTPVTLLTGEYGLNLLTNSPSSFTWSVIPAPGLSNVAYVNYMATGV